MADTAEFYFEESRRLKNKYEPGSVSDFHQWQNQRQSKLAQLEAVNVELERMVSELEEDRRRGADSGRLRCTYAQRCCVGSV